MSHVVSASETQVATTRASADPSDPDEHVVLVDDRGRPTGIVAKHLVHHASTPLHLAFSCHLVRADGRMLLTRRSATKRTWPGAWTNGCCGHPSLGETLRETVARRIRHELGLEAQEQTLLIPDFVYRAEAAGLVEHELCPVVVAGVDGDPCPDPDEVDDFAWVSWQHLVERAHDDPRSLSPWCGWQVRRMAALGWSPPRWRAGERFAVSQHTLDTANDEHRRQPAPRRHNPLAVVEQSVGPLLRREVARRTDAIANIDGALFEVAEQIQLLVAAGGKRLRPAFVYWGHRATGATHDDGVFHVAAAMELLHTFALLHDDVMDRSDRRRNRPTANRALADQHRRTGRAGDSEWFGISASILAGDLAFVWADEVLHAAPLDAAAIGRGRQVFDELRTEVLAGQFLDLLHAGNARLNEAQAAKVALLKSARYTVTRPLLLGAALAEPAFVESDLADVLRAYGDAVGMAFQLRDDVLGMFGDPAATGKSDVDDLREGKSTLLVVRARRLATRAQREVLDRCLGDGELDDAGADDVRSVVAATGALASIETMLTALHLTAAEAAAALPPPVREALIELSDLAIVRTS